MNNERAIHLINDSDDGIRLPKGRKKGANGIPFVMIFSLFLFSRLIDLGQVRKISNFRVSEPNVTVIMESVDYGI